MLLLDKIENRRAVISIIGLGYVGLPLAVVLAKAGFPVVGIDIDRSRVEAVNRGESYIRDVSSERLAPLVHPGTRGNADWVTGLSAPPKAGITATVSYAPIEDSDIVLMCLPTPLSKTRDPDLSHIASVTGEIARYLHRGMLIVLESTTYPGATEELVLSQLQTRAPGQQLEVGKDFFLAFSPERVDPGRTDWTISNTPRVVGGMTPACTQVAMALYETVTECLVPVSSPRVAEMVKLLENTFRAINIGLANEVAIMCDKMGIDVWEVIEAAKTKPFGFMAFFPGPGLGGHCLPLDPQYLAWKMRSLDYNARFIQLADEVNLGMPLYWVNKAQDALNDIGKPLRGSTVLVLGAAYKPDVDDARESPALDVIDHLLRKGAIVSYHDPNVPSLKTDSFDLASIENAELGFRLSDSDCVLIVTDHSVYDWDDVRMRASLIVDTRNALGKSRVRREAAAVETVSGPGVGESA